MFSWVERGEANKICRRVILPEIRPHAVEAAVIHQIGFLKPRLAGLDIGCCHQNSAAGGNEPVRKGWRRFVSQLGGPAENGEGHDADDQQDPFEDVAHGVFGGPLDPFYLRRHACVPPPL